MAEVKFEVIIDTEVILTLWAGSSDAEKRLLNLVNLEGWYGFTVNIETAPNLFSDTDSHYFVDSEVPVREISVVADVTSQENEDLEEIYMDLALAAGNRAPCLLRRVRTRDGVVTTEALSGFVTAVPEWSMRQDHDGGFTFTVTCLDPYKYVTIDGVSMGKML